MSQSLCQIYTHMIFSTKDRYPFIKKEIRAELNAYMAKTLQTLDSPPLVVNCESEHIHALFLLSKNLSIAKLIEEAKKPTSQWMKTKGADCKKFYWQGGYAAFSVSSTRLLAVTRYIENQERHHKTLTFKEEVLKFLDEYHVKYDERYLWD